MLLYMVADEKLKKNYLTFLLLKTLLLIKLKFDVKSSVTLLYILSLLRILICSSVLIDFHLEIS